MRVSYSLIETATGNHYRHQQEGRSSLAWLWLQASNHWSEFRIYIYRTEGA